MVKIKKILVLLIALLIITSVTANLKETIIQSSTNVDSAQLGKIKLILPIKIQVNVIDTNETLFIELNKQGKVKFLTQINKPDIELSSTEDVFMILLTNKNYDPALIDQMIIKANTFKGKTVIEFTEDLTGLKLIKQKDFSEKTISLAIKPLTFFISRFR